MIKTKTFQGEKYLKNAKNYFEGWYFKNCINDVCISFIPGISINNKEKHAFIQIVYNANSFYVPYKIEEFKYSDSPFYVTIRR